MKSLSHLLQNNKRWAAERLAANPQHFENLVDAQDPDYLWIGCSDSRVPATQIVGLKPGELFVHRNVANLASSHDESAQCVLAYAVNELKVDHIIVCGHYGCGGIAAALGPTRPWAIQHWIEPIRSLASSHQRELDKLNPAARWRRLCEINVADQVANLHANPILRDAWMRGDAITIHGWMYELATGLLHDLALDTDRPF